jgi:hypothetical protein
MTTVPIDPYPDIAPPAGYEIVDDWNQVDPHPYRAIQSLAVTSRSSSDDDLR